MESRIDSSSALHLPRRPLSVDFLESFERLRVRSGDEESLHLPKDFRRNPGCDVALELLMVEQTLAKGDSCWIGPLAWLLQAPL
jgi:hypothetical protein